MWQFGTCGARHEEWNCRNSEREGDCSPMRMRIGRFQTQNGWNAFFCAIDGSWCLWAFSWICIQQSEQKKSASMMPCRWIEVTEVLLLFAGSWHDVEPSRKLKCRKWMIANLGSDWSSHECHERFEILMLRRCDLMQKRYDAYCTPVHSMECDFHMPWILIVDKSELFFRRTVSQRDSVVTAGGRSDDGRLRRRRRLRDHLQYQ
jgi:hypothetical protein